MSNFYTATVRLVSNRLDYLVPDFQKISGAKYKWFPENKGIPNSIQCECCFEYPDVVSTTENLKIITEQDYLDFSKIITTVNKTQIKSDGIDYPIITAEFPEAGGIAVFYIKKPDGEKKTIEIMIPANKIITLDKKNLTVTEKGVITINIRSNKWYSVTGLGVIYIEST